MEKITFSFEVDTLYCVKMECEVEVKVGFCDLKIGSVLGQSSCPYKYSFSCPLPT